MHQFCSANDRIHRAGLNTKRTSYATQFIDQHDGFGCLFTIFRVERFCFTSQQIGQGFDTCLTTGWALIDIGLLAGYGLGIGSTAGVATLRALGLW